MKTSLIAIGGLLAASLMWNAFRVNAETPPTQATTPATVNNSTEKVVKTDAEWKKVLTPEQYYILRQEGTERAGTGALLEEKRKGTFVCAGCNAPLFSSETKFESGTGWPSFWKPIAGRVAEKTDADGGRVEVECARCDGHLGHVFDDGPKPTGLRYCMNSVALGFAPAK